MYTTRVYTHGCTPPGYSTAGYTTRV